MKFIPSSLEIIVVDFLRLRDDNFFGGESGSSSLSSIIVASFVLSEVLTENLGRKN